MKPETWSAVCKVLEQIFYVWKLQEAAQDSLTRPPDHFLMVQYPSECGHEPLQFYWFRSAVKLFNSMLNTNSDILRRVVQADLIYSLVQVPAGQLNC